MTHKNYWLVLADLHKDKNIISNNYLHIIVDLEEPKKIISGLQKLSIQITNPQSQILFDRIDRRKRESAG